MIRTLQWDSDFFELKVGEIKYDENYNEKDFANYDLIYLISDEDVTLSLPGFDNTFSETKVIFAKDIDKNASSNEFIFDFEDVDINVEQLYLLAYESGKNSRFLLDTKFDKSRFEKLYRTWIDNSINKKIADGILVFYEEDTLKGFVTYKVDGTSATVGLIAVEANFQGKGIGAKLLVRLEQLLSELKVEQLNIPTQLSNIQACNFYAKQGYSIKNKISIKHYWKK